MQSTSNIEVHMWVLRVQMLQISISYIPVKAILSTVYPSFLLYSTWVWFHNYAKVAGVIKHEGMYFRKYFSEKPTSVTPLTNNYQVYSVCWFYWWTLEQCDELVVRKNRSQQVWWIPTRAIRWRNYLKLTVIKSMVIGVWPSFSALEFVIGSYWSLRISQMRATSRVESIPPEKRTATWLPVAIISLSFIDFCSISILHSS